MISSSLTLFLSPCVPWSSRKEWHGPEPGWEYISVRAYIAPCQTSVLFRIVTHLTVHLVCFLVYLTVPVTPDLTDVLNPPRPPILWILTVSEARRLLLSHTTFWEDQKETSVPQPSAWPLLLLNPEIEIEIHKGCCIIGSFPSVGGWEAKRKLRLVSEPNKLKGRKVVGCWYIDDERERVVEKKEDQELLGRVSSEIFD